VSKSLTNIVSRSDSIESAVNSTKSMVKSLNDQLSSLYNTLEDFGK